MRDKKKAIFRYESLSMCFIVLFTALRSPNIQYGVYPFVLVPFRLPVSYPIESLSYGQKKGGLPRLVPDSYLFSYLINKNLKTKAGDIFRIAKAGNKIAKRI